MIMETERLLLAAGLMAMYLLMCGLIWHRQLRKKPGVTSASSATVLLGWASQSGDAQQLAEQLAVRLESAGQQVVCVPLHKIGPELLRQCTTQLYVASTYDDGLAPEHARRFLSVLDAVTLQHANVQLLGLGDRRYPHFCRFAHQLQEALLARGASLALPLITVDCLHEHDLLAWHAAVNQRFGLADAAEAASDQWLSASLVARQYLNPHSASPGLYLLRFAVSGVSWQPGDTIRVRPFNQSSLALREYSIASAPGGSLDLVVRVAGQCSQWLCHELQEGAALAFQFCTRPAFAPVAPEVPAIFIGAGSGLAGLRGHIMARDSGTNWLIFGERCPQTDRMLEQETASWLARGRLQRLDYVFSRDPETPAYVQDCLQHNQKLLRQWLEQGAVVYLCGSLQGMGRGVQEKLVQLLGKVKVEQLAGSGRLRMDLY